MICTIIPCYNEALYIEKVLYAASKSNTDRILVVDNGSYDGTTDIIKKFPSDKVDLLFFNIPLGYDVPRSLGLFHSLMDKDDSFVFIDGDMSGVTSEDINSIIASLKSGADLSLTDCYYDGKIPTGLAKLVLHFRKALNKKLKIFDKIKFSTPSHGPHGISKKLASSIPVEYASIPSLLLSYAAKNNYSINIGLNKLHRDMVPDDDETASRHALDMAETLIGDCISGMNSTSNKKISRKYEGIDYIGYHKDRRFDILELITGKPLSFKI